MADSKQPSDIAANKGKLNKQSWTEAGALPRYGREVSCGKVTLSKNHLSPITMLYHVE